MFRFLKCLLIGHKYDRWWYIDTPEATHRNCTCCGAMQTPKQRNSWFKREREPDTF